jgi:hypothetical protein
MTDLIDKIERLSAAATPSAQMAMLTLMGRNVGTILTALRAAQHAEALAEALDRTIAGLSEAELVEEFRAMFNWNGGQRMTAKAWADAYGFSQAYVSDVLHGRRGIADRMARALGYDMIVMFVPRRPQAPTGDE